jgi:hypothetical protein
LKFTNLLEVGEIFWVEKNASWRIFSFYFVENPYRNALATHDGTWLSYFKIMLLLAGCPNCGLMMNSLEQFSLLSERK